MEPRRSLGGERYNVEGMGDGGGVAEGYLGLAVLSTAKPGGDMHPTDATVEMVDGGGIEMLWLLSGCMYVRTVCLYVCMLGK
jgi:hypothetical protein